MRTSYPSYLIPVLIAGILLSGTSCAKWNLEERDFPEVKTLSAFFTSTTSLVFFAELSGLNRTIASEHGFVWSTTLSEPTLQDNDGIVYLGASGSQEFNHEVSNLERNQTYFFRAFAVYQGTAIFGETIEAQTGDVILQTLPVNYVRGKTLDLVGELLFLDPGVGATQYGHCWGGNPEPTLTNSLSSYLGRPSQDGYFYTTLDNLTTNQNIYYRAYLLTNFGNDTLYGDVAFYTTQLVDVWDFISLFPDSYMQGGVSFVINNEAYVGIGTDQLNDLWKFNPLTNAWTQMQPFPGPPNELATSFVIGNTAYVGLGDNPDSDQFYKYANNTWTPIAAPFPGGPRYRAMGIAAGGKGYVGLGIQHDNFNVNFDDIYAFDPITEQWDPDPITFPGGPNNSPVYFNLADTIYIIGGALSNDVYAFDPASDTWQQRAIFPGGNTELGTGFTIGQTGYLACGFQGGYGWSDKLWAYDAATDTWTRKASLPGEARRYPSSFVLDGQAYIVGGELISLSSPADIWRYTPD